MKNSCGIARAAKKFCKSIKNKLQLIYIEEFSNNPLEDRAIFKNMGIALPGGIMEEVAKILATNETMGWWKCTSKEALECVGDGTAAIAVKRNEIDFISKL